MRLFTMTIVNDLFMPSYSELRFKTGFKNGTKNASLLNCIYLRISLIIQMAYRGQTSRNSAAHLRLVASGL